MTWRKTRQWSPVVGTFDVFLLAAADVTWTVHAVRSCRTRVNPSGEVWRAFRNGEPITTPRGAARSWRSRFTACAVVDELARLGLGRFFPKPFTTVRARRCRRRTERLRGERLCL